MKMKRTKHILGIYLIAIIGLLPIACSDKDDPAPDNGKKITMKVTLNVTGADEDDQIDFSIAAGNHNTSQYGEPVWKMNGTTQGNEHQIMLDTEDFLGNTKTYVLETVKPYDFGNLIVSVSNYDGAPIILSYKVEIDGKVETNVDKLAIPAGKTESKNLTYQSKK